MKCSLIPFVRFLFILGMPLFYAAIALADITDSDCAGCFWGKLGERTTYQQPYCPAMAPEIPYGPSAQEQEMIRKKLPTRPEDALKVVMSDGCTYHIYYRETVRYRPVAEYQTVFEPMQKNERVPVSQVNPYTGMVETQWYDEPMQTVFPVLHEKETIRYVPEKVLVRVIIPGTPSADSGYNSGNLGSAQLHFENDIVTD